VTVRRGVAAVTSSRLEELPDVTIILAVCKAPERKSTTDPFSAFLVSTEHVPPGTSSSQARNTYPASPVERSSRIVLPPAPPPAFSGGEAIFGASTRLAL